MTKIPEDRPMTETEWERFMLESDIRSARYGELLETLREHPDCDQIIAHEMGWDKADDEDVDEDFARWKEEVITAAVESQTEEQSREDDASDGESEGDEFDRDMEQIPAYKRAYDWGLSVHRALQAPMSETGEIEPDDPLLEAYSNSLVVAAKIAGGHGMNFDGDDDTLCGNIVCCKKALDAAEKSLAALAILRQQGTFPADSMDALIAEGVLVRELVAERIAELRSRVWWS